MADMVALSDAVFLEATVDTSGRTVAEVADDIRPLLRLRGEVSAAPSHRPPRSPVPVTVVCGPRCVGKSSVSWSLFAANLDAR